MAESRNDPGDDFTVAVLADQDMRALSTVTERDHELLGVPKRQDDMAPFAIQRIHGFMAAGLQPHGPRDAADHRRTDRRQQ